TVAPRRRHRRSFPARRSSDLTPCVAFDRQPLPAGTSPIRLLRIRLLFVPPCHSPTPWRALPEMTLRLAMFGVPMALLLAPCSMWMPCAWSPVCCGERYVPAALVPMKLPAIVLLSAELP